MRWLWAAYQMGTFFDLLTDELPQRDYAIDLIGSFDYDWILEVSTSTGLRPAGIVFADSRFSGNALEPHVTWFPWANARNRLECSIQFLKHVGKETKLFLYITKKDEKFWHRVWQYKVLKKGCSCP